MTRRVVGCNDVPNVLKILLMCTRFDETASFIQASKTRVDKTASFVQASNIRYTGFLFMHFCHGLR